MSKGLSGLPLCKRCRARWPRRAPRSKRPARSDVRDPRAIDVDTTIAPPRARSANPATKTSRARTTPLGMGRFGRSRASMSRSKRVVQQHAAHVEEGKRHGENDRRAEVETRAGEQHARESVGPDGRQVRNASEPQPHPKTLARVGGGRRHASSSPRTHSSSRMNRGHDALGAMLLGEHIPGVRLDLEVRAHGVRLQGARVRRGGSAACPRTGRAPRGRRGRENEPARSDLNVSSRTPPRACGRSR